MLVVQQDLLYNQILILQQVLSYENIPAECAEKPTRNVTDKYSDLQVNWNERLRRRTSNLALSHQKVSNE